jgi:hypothetical protein
LFSPLYFTWWNEQNKITLAYVLKIFKSILFALYLHMFIFEIHFKFCFHCCVLCDGWTKQDPNCIYFKEFLNQLNLLYIYNRSRVMNTWAITTDQKLWIRELMSRIRGCDHSLCQNDILKFVYCFMILFL